MSAMPKVLVTQPDPERQLALLATAGCEGIPFPTIAIETVEQHETGRTLLCGLDRVDEIVFPSRNCVRYFFQLAHHRKQRLDPRTQVTCIGSETAALCRDLGVRVDRLAPGSTEASLIETLAGEPLVGRTFLLPKGDLGSGKLAKFLRDHGAEASALLCYRTVIPAMSDTERLHALLPSLAAVTFTSPSTVRNLITLAAGKPLNQLVAASIGPTTTTEAKRHFTTVLQAPHIALRSMIDLLASKLLGGR